MWISNLLFGDELMDRMVVRLEDAPATLRAVAVLKRLPEGIDGFEEDPNPQCCEMTWTRAQTRAGHPPPPGHPCVIYSRYEGMAPKLAGDELQERIFATAFEWAWDKGVGLAQSSRPV